MANLHILEAGYLASGDDPVSEPLFDASSINATQVVAIGALGTSAAFASSKQASPNGQPTEATKWVKVTAGAACSIAFGVAPLAAAGGWFLATGETQIIRVPGNLGYKVAVIADSL